jgi:hypothetical protein
VLCSLRQRAFLFHRHHGEQGETDTFQLQEMPSAGIDSGLLFDQPPCFDLRFMSEPFPVLSTSMRAAAS